MKNRDELMEALGALPRWGECSSQDVNTWYDEFYTTIRAHLSQPLPEEREGALEAVIAADHMTDGRTMEIDIIYSKTIRAALEQPDHSEAVISAKDTIIEGLMQNTESQKQTHDVLIKRLAASEEAVRQLAAALRIADRFGRYDPLLSSIPAATIKNVGGA